MFSILLAALSAVVWGTSDFSGGKASQRANALAVTVVSQVAGLPVLVLSLLVVHGGWPGFAALGWGAVAGLGGFCGIVLLYRGLSQGAMAVFAPVTAVGSAVVPLVAGLFLDRRPSLPALVGVGCAVAAIAMVSLTGGGGGKITPRLVGMALFAGAMFGLLFTLLGRSGADAGLWPLVGVRAASIGTGLLVAARTRTRIRLPRESLGPTLIAGPLDILANALYMVAAQHGLLSVVAPISALYPVSTVLLAFGVDRERVRPVQLAGLGLAAAALVLVAS